MDRPTCQAQNYETVVRPNGRTNGNDDRRTDFQELNRAPSFHKAGANTKRSASLMKKALFATILLAAIPAMAADEPKPMPQDSQVKMLKAQRDLQQVQIQMDGRQNQYTQAL